MPETRDRECPATVATPGSATGVGRCFGTFGELIQGALPSDASPGDALPGDALPGDTVVGGGESGEAFMVTLPVSRWSVAVFRPGHGEVLRVHPPGKSKSRTLAVRLLARRGLPRGGALTLRSALPVGSGMASSSADMVAAARAIGDAYGFTPQAAELEDLMRSIEPTDGVMYDGCVAFDHRAVRLRARLGPPPALTIVGLDEGGAVDTIQVNRAPTTYSAQERGEYAALLTAARTALRDGDAETLGCLASRSAVMNERLRPKRMLDAALAISRRTGALGVAAAHSGTKLGVLLADTDPDYQLKLGRVLEACHAICGQISVDYTLARGSAQPIAAPRL